MLHRMRGEVSLAPGGGILLITVHPERLAREVLAEVNVVVATGDEPGPTFRAFAEAAGVEAPGEPQGDGPTVLWRAGNDPVRFRIAESRSELRRHVRKT
jgi:hypothetical protein